MDSSVEENLSFEELTEDILKLDSALQRAITNIADKPHKKKGTKPVTDFQVGMKVMRQNVWSQQRKGSKLDPTYLGPYTILAIVGKSVDLLDGQGMVVPKIDKDHLGSP